MRAKLHYLLFLLSSSLWLVPACLMLAAALLAWLTLRLDASLELALPVSGPWALDLDPDGARVLLSTIASSMITVAALVFSMTLVVLTLASNQLGPRIITRFMSDWINQAVLGTFVATFLYAVLVLQGVAGEGAGTGGAVPRISLLVALAATVVNLGWLVYFIHHVANAIQADIVIADINAELRRAVTRRFPRLSERRGRIEAPPPPPGPAATITPEDSGYVQAVDAPTLLAAASEHDLVLALEHRPGDFVIADFPIIRVWPKRELPADLVATLRGAVVIGRKRNPTEDIEFAISQLVDIALRAMSPSLNDPQTAIACIDHLGETLVGIMQTDAPLALIEDEAGADRLILRPVSFEEALGAAFDQIRQFAQTYFKVLMRLIEILTTLAAFARAGAERRALAQQAAIVERACREVMRDPVDLRAAEDRLAAFRATLDRTAVVS